MSAATRRRAGRCAGSGARSRSRRRRRLRAAGRCAARLRASRAADALLQRLALGPVLRAPRQSSASAGRVGRCGVPRSGDAVRSARRASTPEQPREIRLARPPRRLRASMRSSRWRDSCASADSTSFGGIEPCVEPLRRSRDVRLDACRATASTTALGFARRDERPERAGDLEPQVRARRREVRRRRPSRSARGRALERLESGRRCRSATADRAASGSCPERRGR